MYIFDTLLGQKDMNDGKAIFGSTQGFDGTKPSAELHSRIWLDPTCGVRCLACVGVVIFHMAWYTGLASDDKHAMEKALAQHPWFTFVFNPEPPMQAFMCLTGYAVQDTYTILLTQGISVLVTRALISGAFLIVACRFLAALSLVPALEATHSYIKTVLR